MSHEASPSSDSHHTISLCVASPSFPPEALWTSDPFPSGDPAPPLLLQLLRELPTLAAPAPPPPPRDPPALTAGDELPNLLALLLLARFFWPCAFHPSPDVGALYFNLLASAFPAALACRAALRDLLLHVGPDLELLLARALAYALSKLCCLRDLSRAQLPAACSLSYAADIHGLWTLRGYAPVAGMPIAHRQGAADLEARDPALRYALAHQILEAVLQFEYEVRSGDERYLEVAVRVDNLRVRVSRLRIGATAAAEEEEEKEAERHFPSRVRVLVAPDAAERGVAGLSLGRSTGNPWREVERGQRVRGRFGGKGGREVEAEARAAWRARGRGWRWEQEAEGNAAVFEGVLCDAASGEEVAGWRGGAAADPRRGMRGRCRGAARALGKSGGVVVAGDEFGEWVRWRVGRGDEGREIAWRIAGKVWISYCANEVSTSYFETRFVEWEDVVRLRLRSTGN